MPERPARPSPFGEELRGWRRRRGLSQLALANLAGTTPRHVSFVETGRSRPGRALVLRLAAGLDLPARDQNALLARAGWAPAFAEHALNAEALAPVMASIRGVLDGHDPNPAAVVDVRGRTLLANAAARRFFPGAERMTAEQSIDAFYGHFGPAHFENWSEVAWSAVDRRRRLALGSGDPELTVLLERAEAHLRHVPRPPEPGTSPEPPVVLARLRLRGERISVFSAVMRFETARDVTLSELGVELTFPADERSARFFRRHAVESGDGADDTAPSD